MASAGSILQLKEILETEHHWKLFRRPIEVSDRVLQWGGGSMWQQTKFTDSMTFPHLRTFPMLQRWGTNTLSKKAVVLKVWHGRDPNLGNQKTETAKQTLKERGPQQKDPEICKRIFLLSELTAVGLPKAQLETAAERLKSWAPRTWSSITQAH